MSKINVSDWKEFKVTNLLNWYHGRRRKRNDLDLVDFKIKPDLVGYLTAGFDNQGAIGSCSPTMFSDETDAIFNRSITIDMFGNSFFHTYPCAGDDNVYFLTSNKYSDNQMLFLTGIINSITSSKFGYNDQFRQHNLETLTIKLPVTSTGEPDWDYMDEYIEKLATQARKNVSSLATLKPVEHKIDIKAWKEFHLYDLFDIDSGSKLDHKDINMTEGSDYNYIGRTGDNNGLIGTSGLVTAKNKKPYPAGCLTVSLGGTVGATFLQEKPFYTGQNVDVLIPLKPMPTNVKQFIAACIYKEAQLNYSAFIKELNAHIRKDFYIKLPVTSTGQPDFDYMEKYIDGVQSEAHESLELLKQI